MFLSLHLIVKIKYFSLCDALCLADGCYNFSSRHCKSPMYWYKGFLSLQSSIDAAIIEVNPS